MSSAATCAASCAAGQGTCAIPGASSAFPAACDIAATGVPDSDAFCASEPAASTGTCVESARTALSHFERQRHQSQTAQAAQQMQATQTKSTMIAVFESSPLAGLSHQPELQSGKSAPSS
eukprot:CAMPEP_0203932462 /NCGR_PEP_ID=MMETSP0359-20131031/70853_1 /ASSEMBLY_ACC=CAM_ASM_000338 /TAXON_ID=268821 /ORGANISM="Scrippsiella Hangoei, Strain SHTV-5" /LENGTH=119 /DNA_ID=CAMNT_0050861905 /DNA_START=189 /DNA_END=544 /DNA_ORIENTATION=+